MTNPFNVNAKVFVPSFAVNPESEPTFNINAPVFNVKAPAFVPSSLPKQYPPGDGMFKMGVPSFGKPVQNLGYQNPFASSDKTIFEPEVKDDGKTYERSFLLNLRE